MTKYAVHLLNDRGHVVGQVIISCGSDDEARLAAKRHLNPNGQAEVWAGTRCIGQVFSDTMPSVVTREPEPRFQTD
jgi:hypothetical protein